MDKATRDRIVADVTDELEELTELVADVVEHIRGDKKLTYKMRRRKGYRKTIGHRQELTIVKIKEIKA